MVCWGALVLPWAFLCSVEPRNCRLCSTSQMTWRAPSEGHQNSWHHPCISEMGCIQQLKGEQGILLWVGSSSEAGLLQMQFSGSRLRAGCVWWSCSSWVAVVSTDILGLPRTLSDKLFLWNSWLSCLWRDAVTARTTGVQAQVCVCYRHWGSAVQYSLNRMDKRKYSWRVHLILTISKFCSRIAF